MAPLDQLFQQIADDNRPRGVLASAVQAACGLVAPAYGAGTVLNRLLHTTGLRPRRRLPVPVLSVGNITVGGTGKTPFCLWLVDWLRSQGRRPAIATRGYGREDEDRLVVVHDGRRLLAGTRTAGDEPVLLARTLAQTPVVACADRHRAGSHAIRHLHADTIVLDDGFQHHALDRQADIVIVDATRPLSRLRLLPRGTLREPASALQRAHLIVITRWMQARHPERVLREVKAIAPSVPVVRTRMTISRAYVVATGQEIPLESLHGRSALLASAIGNPMSFRRITAQLGLRVLGQKTLRDHSPISKEFLLRYDSHRRRVGADYIIVTEKDAVKLQEGGRVVPEVIALRVRVDFLEDHDRATAERVLSARLAAGATRGLLT
jgi:tetraacyldisaccharide 4'-kinase